MITIAADLVLRQGDMDGYRATPMRQCKAQAAGNGAPLARTATPQWRIGVAPFGRDDKPSSALLCSLELATASTAVARLTANGFSTRCIHQYHLYGVLADDVAIVPTNSVL